MKLKVYFFLLLAFVVANTTNAQTTVIDSIVHDGIYRNYRLYVPALYTGTTARPLVLNLHGYTSSATEQQFYGYFGPVADTANFLILLPNGTRDNSGQPFWNAFDLPSVDDVGFLSALIDTISAQYNIDPTRIYSTGMSNGGIMSYKLACVLSNKIAAIASVTGSMVTSGQCAPVHPVPVMEIHGTADATVPYNGTSGLQPISTVLNYWVNFNNCNPVPDSSDVPNTSTTDGCTAKHYVWAGGDNGATVEHFKIVGGGHTWPGALFNVGVTNQDINACNEIWRFFSKYTLQGLTSINNTKAQPLFTVYPNPSSGSFMLNFATDAKKTLTVVNAQGQLVQQLTVAGTQVELTVPAAGMYFVTVADGAKLYSQKLVKE